MTPKEVRELELTLDPCAKCGGRLFISGYSGKSSRKGLVHLVIRCKKCGDWRGGFTHKNNHIKGD
jgi:hypothetical protein